MVITDFVNDSDKFALDGVSSDTLGLFVDYLPPVPMPEQKYNDYNIGEDEQITIPDDVFNNIVYRIRFYTFKPDNFDDSAIKAYCFGKTSLMISRVPNYYYKIRKMSLQVTDSLGYAMRTDYVLTLTLAPFKYLVDNDEVTLAGAGDVVNEHTRYSKPVFKITGTGDIKLTVNGDEFEVKGLTSGQTVVIDSQRHITYSGSTLLTGQTEGKYPLFGVGSNSVSWTGTVTAVKYTPNWRDW